MLCLSRKPDQRVVVHVPPSDEWRRLVININDVRGEKVILGFEAHPSLRILREELGEYHAPGEKPGAKEASPQGTGPAMVAEQGHARKAAG